MTRSIILGFLLGIVPLAGCCPVQPSRVVDLTKLPPPITIDEQARRIGEWQRAMPLVRATSVPLGVRFDYRDDKGQNKSTNAEGTLLVRQHFDDGKAADVLLLGKAFDQPVFEAGRNEKAWWFLIRMDTKTAWVGDATRPVTWAANSGGRSESILRADLVPELLGLAALPPVNFIRATDGSALLHLNAPVPAQGVVQRVNDFDGSNDLAVITLPSGPWTLLKEAFHVEREIIVDRVTGNIREVRIYNPDGVVMVRSELSDYRPVTFSGDQEKPANVPQFPRRVTVSYPAQHMTIALQFDRVVVPATLPPAAFETPDFAKEQLQVVPVE